MSTTSDARVTRSCCSVIVPTYRHARYIAQTLDSLFGQSRPPDQIIVVNDGSPDDTDEAIFPFLKNITYIKQSNRGVSSALNRGLEVVTSDYVMFLASDDWLYPHALQCLQSVLDERSRVGVVYGQVNVVDEYGIRAATATRPSNRDVVGEYQPLKAILGGSFLPAPASLFRLTAVRQAGSFANFIYCQDWFMAIFIAMDGWSYCGLPDIVANYRRHSGNVTRASNTRNMLLEEVEMLKCVQRSKRLEQFPECRAATHRTIRQLEQLLAWNDLGNERVFEARTAFRTLFSVRGMRLNATFGMVIAELPRPVRVALLTARRSLDSSA